MIRCLLGERKSGKSVYIENHVKKMGGRILYIATLPELRMYKEVIKEHQERRPVSWVCIELFKMSAYEMLTYPYGNFRSIILDNLTYYLLFQLYFQRENFLGKCEEGFFSLISRIARNSNTTVYFVDTPVEPYLLVDAYELQVIPGLLNHILTEANAIERYYSDNKICKMTLEEGKRYLFRE